MRTDRPDSVCPKLSPGQRKTMIENEEESGVGMQVTGNCDSLSTTGIAFTGPILVNVNTALYSSNNRSYKPKTNKNASSAATRMAVLNTNHTVIIKQETAPLS